MTCSSGSASSSSVPVKFSFPIPFTAGGSRHPPLTPELVQITGTFNGWQCTEPLTLSQDGSCFEGIFPIDLDNGQEHPQQQPSDLDTTNTKKNEGTGKKILFKFILDNNEWVTDPDQELERDHAGNLNNILFLDNTATATSAVGSPISQTPSNENEQQHTLSAPATPAARSVSSSSPANESESEKERTARLKQEEEDDATIRQLGGGMWGTPFFSVNDPTDLPEHFVTNTNIDDGNHLVDTLKNDEIVETVALDPKEYCLSEPQQKAVELVIGAMTAAVPESAVVEQINEKKANAQNEEMKKSEAEKTEDKDEDEDEKVIRTLGGGMWGTPFFQVNDPAVTTLPEHFVEAISINTSDATKEDAEITVIGDRDPMKTTAINLQEDLYEGEVLKDEVQTTIEGTLIETVVETTEDTVIEAPDGTVLEETITTSVEDTISGQLHENVTEVVETIEDIEPPTATEETTLPSVTMTETETIVEGDDGVETTVLEETITFTDGLEADASSQHSLTTAIKPLQDGESVVIEQLPQVVVVTSSPSIETVTTVPILGMTTTTAMATSTNTSTTTAAATTGDAKPSVDESTDIITAPSLISSSTTTSTTASSASVASTSQVYTVKNTKVHISVNGDEHDGDGDYGVVMLHSSKQDLSTPVHNGILSGDATPTMDLSTVTFVPSTTMTDVHVTAGPELLKADKPSTTATETTTTTEQKTDKVERRKSFWKKIKTAFS